jgi:hypothetical protein
MSAEWLSIEAVAGKLGVAPRTARRWIREGKIHAELRRGANGTEYQVPEGQLRSAVAIKAAVQHQSPLDDYLNERDGNVISLLEQLRDRLAVAAESQTSLEERIREEMRQIHQQLAAGIEALRHAHVHEVAPPEPTPARKWWPFGR